MAASASMALAHAVAQTPPSPNAAPLPNGDQLLQRAIANQAKLAAEQERYECRVSDKIPELDSKGKVKRTSTELKEQFYVNGAAVERTLAKDGKNLTPDQTKKEDERVMKETLKNSETKAKKKPDQESPDQRSKVQQMMVAMILANGHRESVDGRSVLLYDIAPNPNFHARSTNERLAQVMQGKISIDETTGEPIDIEMRTTQDFKIAGGVLATIHKGLRIHIHDHPQPDGVWLTDLVEGSGDARAALFLHPWFRFKETAGDCHLYTTTANQVGQAKLVK
jgi:hypothetical protein